MTWFTQAATRWGKSPIWLFTFDVGGTITRLTSNLSDYTDGAGNTWTAANINKPRIRKTQEGERAAVRMLFPKSNAFALSLRGDLSFEDIRITISHEYRGSTPPDREDKFYGRVIGTEEGVVTITVVAENDFTYMRNRGRNTVLQRPCRHGVYVQTVDGYGCRALLADFQTAGTISAMTGEKTLTITEASAQADGYYTRGIIEWNGLKQLIADHTGSTISLHRPLSGLSAAFGVSGSEASLIAPGCNGTRAVCNGTFNRGIDHGGFPHATDFIGDGRTLF